MDFSFLILRTATEDLGYYAVIRGTSRNWFYDAVRGELTIHTKFEEPPFDLTETTYVRNEIRPENIPANIRAAFGSALKAAVKEAIDIASLMGVDAAPPGVSNFIGGGVSGSASVTQGGDMRMPRSW